MPFPFPERYRGERRSGADRRGDQRPDPTPRRQSPDRRTEVRHPVPLNAGSVSGCLTLADGSQWRASLWNISGSGACAVVAGDVEVSPGETAYLSLTEDLGPGSIELTVQMRWGESWVRRSFVGLEIEGGGRLAGGTFLDDYMTQGWAG